MGASRAPAAIGGGLHANGTGPGSDRFPGGSGVEPIFLTLDVSGRFLELLTLRWSDDNPAGTYGLQPFGGRMLTHATH